MSRGFHDESAKLHVHAVNYPLPVWVGAPTGTTLIPYVASSPGRATPPVCTGSENSATYGRY